MARAPQNRLWSSTVIPMGVDLDLFRPPDREDARTRLGLAGDRRYVLFVAHPASRCKRHDIAAAAAGALASSDPALELLAVHGVRHDLVPCYLNAGDALILTSDHEASPCVVKEALVCNLPAVAVVVGDVRERLTAVVGCHVTERSVEDLAMKLRLALAAGRAVNGRDRARVVSLEVTGERTREVLARAARR